MSTDPALLAGAKPRAPRPPQPGELLFEFLRGHDRFRCELRDHAPYGIEAQWYQNEEFLYSRRFEDIDPTLTGRALAVAWAEHEREALTRSDEE
jgi:hypothetical protein